MTDTLKLVGLILASACSLAACGQSSAPSSSSVPSSSSAGPTLPAIQFVGNATCPTAGAQPYYTNAPTVHSLPPVGQPVDEMPHTHVVPPAQVTYTHNPPASGCHYSLGYGNAPIQAGVYDQVIPPEYWVHNLEHGYIAVLYNCPNGCASQFQQLRDWFHSLPRDPSGKFLYAKVIIIPWATLPVPFACVCWDWYDPIPNFSVTEVQRFYVNHVDEGPEQDSS